MEIKIVGWETEGFWGPDLKLDFDKKDKSNLLLMENGIGKTTTITLIKIALFGEPNLNNLRTDKAKNDNNEALKQLVRPNAEIGKFTLNCSFDNSPWSFIVEIDRTKTKEDEIIRFWTSNPSSGKEPGYRRPPNAKRYLTPEFGLNFIYDARRDNDLIKEGNSARTAIYTLCQFNVLEDVVSQAKRHLEERAKRGGGKGSVGRVSELNKIIEFYKDTLLELKNDKQKTEKFLQDRKEKLDKIKSQLKSTRDKTIAYRESYKKITESQQINNKEIENKTKEIFDSIKTPQQISKETSKHLMSFKSCLEECKLPHTSGSEFFKELAEKTECVCGRPIDIKQKEYILNNAENFLGEEINNVLGGIKKIILDGDAIEYRIEDNLEELITLRQRKTDLQEDLDVLNENTDGNDPKQAKLISDEKQFEIEIEAFELKLRNLNGKIDFNIAKEGKAKPENISTCENLIEQYTDTLIEYTESVSLKKAYEKLAAVMGETLERSKNTIFQKIKENVQKDIDNIYEQHDAVGDEKIIIENMDTYVKLNRGGLSQGQKVAFTYAFLTEVQNYANTKMPFVVDTPTGEIGNKFRPTIGKLIPTYTEQFFGFLQPIERVSFCTHIRYASEDRCSNNTILDVSEEWFKKYKNSDQFNPEKCKYVSQFKKNDFAILSGAITFDEYAPPIEAPKYAENNNES